MALMNSEAELASVLGHEVGHVAARHSSKRSTRSTIGQILAAGVGAVTGSDLAGRVAGYGTQLYSLSFSRSQEYDADGLGVKYITAAGYDPYAASGMLAALDSETRLQGQISGKGGSVPTWVSTHPNGADRIRRAQALAKATGRPAPGQAQDVTFLRSLDGLAYDGPAKGVTGTAATPKVLRIVTARAGDTIASLSSRMAYPDFQRERFMVLNGIEEDRDLSPGMLVKVVSAR
jgi:predicted Zn-dependent protease